MFVSKEHLHANLGVDPEIAAFFVNRRVPMNNLYWKDRLLYISRGTGYLFIPLYFDLQFRCGLEKTVLLKEEYVYLMENLLHHAARHEFERLTLEENIVSCKEVVQPYIVNNGLYEDLLKYFSNEDLRPYRNLGTVNKALNRGDTFLFVLCSLDLPEKVTNQMIDQWYALVPSFLLMDDIMDLQEDLLKHEENSINGFGEGSMGVEHAIQYLRSNFSKLKSRNPQLGAFFERSLERKLQTPYLQTLLNA